MHARLGDTHGNIIMVGRWDAYTRYIDVVKQRLQRRAHNDFWIAYLLGRFLVRVEGVNLPYAAYFGVHPQMVLSHRTDANNPYLHPPPSKSLTVCTIYS